MGCIALSLAVAFVCDALGLIHLGRVSVRLQGVRGVREGFEVLAVVFVGLESYHVSDMGRYRDQGHLIQRAIRSIRTAQSAACQR